MSILKKAVGIGLAASLLAGTMATMLPGTAFAATSVTTVGAGTVVSGGAPAAMTTSTVMTGAGIGDWNGGTIKFTAPAGFTVSAASLVASAPGNTVIGPANYLSATEVEFPTTAFLVSPAGETLTFTATYQADNTVTVGPKNIVASGPGLSSWSGSTTVAVITVTNGAPWYLDIVVPATANAGDTVPVNITVRDFAGNPVLAADTVNLTQSTTAGCGTGTFGTPFVAINALTGQGSTTFTLPTPLNPAGCVYTVLGALASDNTVLGSDSVAIFTPNYLDIVPSNWEPDPGDTVTLTVTVRDAGGNPVLATDTVDLYQSNSCGIAGTFPAPVNLDGSKTVNISNVSGSGTTTFTVPVLTSGGCSYWIDGYLGSNNAVTGFAQLYIPYGPISVTEATVTNTAISGIVAGGPYAGTGEYRITEAYTDTFPANGFKMYIRIRDSAGNNTVHFDTTASSVALSPASLGLSASFMDDSTLVVTSAYSDVFILETLIIGGLKVKADVGAATGAIRTYYALAHRWDGTSIDDPLSIDFGGKTVSSSTGFLYDSEPAGFLWSWPTVQLDNYAFPYPNQSVPDFTITDSLNGNLVIADPNGESVAIYSASAVYPDPGLLFYPLQDLLTDPFADPHAAGTRVSQSHFARNCDTPWGEAPFFTCRLPSIGTVGSALLLSSTSTMIQRGLPNGQLAGMVRINEQTSAQIAAGTVITLKLDSSIGVKFATVSESRVNLLNATGTKLTMANVGTCDVSADRLSLVCTTKTADAGGAISQIEIYNILLDASAASAAAATVKVTVTVGSLTVVNSATGDNTAVIAKLNNTADGTAQSIPTVIIGENDQLTGTVDIREAAAGTFGADPTLGSWMFVCYVDNDVLGSGVELFTRAPYAVVTAGDLQLRSASDPTVAATGVAAGTPVRGEIFFGNTNCASWFIYQYSTVASTIEIRGMGSDGLILPAGPGNGPQVNVPASMTPGPSTLSLKTSPSYNAGGSEFDLVVNANRAYGATPVVAAVSNPEIFRGRISQAAGDVTVTETKTYQLGTTAGVNEAIGFYIVPNSNLDITAPRIYFDSNRDKPVIETNSAATGLVATFGGWDPFWYSGTQAVAFWVAVQQRAYVPITGSWTPGVLTVKNLKYSTTNEAPFGNVVLRVLSSGGLYVPYTTLYKSGTLAENPANFDQTVVNAHVVNPIVFPSVAMAKGYKGREQSPYTLGTVVVQSGQYVTVRVAVGKQFQNLPIQFFQRNGKSGEWVKKTIGRVDANGYAFWSTRPPKLSGTGFDTYVYYRAYFAGTETLASQWSQTIGRAVAR